MRGPCPGDGCWARTLRGRLHSLVQRCVFLLIYFLNLILPPLLSRSSGVVLSFTLLVPSFLR